MTTKDEETEFANPMLTGQVNELWHEAEHLSDRIDEISEDVPYGYQAVFDELHSASATIEGVTLAIYQAYKASEKLGEKVRKA